MVLIWVSVAALIVVAVGGVVFAGITPGFARAAGVIINR